MNIFIYDLEVFKEDWVAVFKDVNSEAEAIAIHNNNHAVREFLKQEDLVLAGFNNKHYDDWVLQSIIKGAEPFKIKEHNDFIINGGNGWEFSYIQYQKKYFKSLDLRDDLPINISLKSIEGCIGAPIVESSVPFDINRKLTPKELDEVIKYCKTDVLNTLKLYNKRLKYLDSKLQVAKLKNIDPAEALGLTNAKLTARFLEAKPQEHNDENVYIVPEELRLNKYMAPLEFFKNPVEYTLQVLRDQASQETRKIKLKSLNNKIKKLEATRNRYECKLEIDIAGVPHVYGWGGLHGAIPNLYATSDENFKIVTIDVGSYYPSMMLEYNYISRNIPSAKGYAEVYHTRMQAKHSGDKATANALKLILNTCYGAMKNPFNDLYDPRNASAICITGQLLLTDLIEKLEAVDGFQLIQSNTDGIIIRYPITQESAVVEIVSEWEKRTRLNMEYTVIHAIAQKDVNNYVMKAGEVYLYKDGEKIVTEQDKGKLKSKGGYVSLSEGGNFINNSMVVLHKALVRFFMDGVDIEETINTDNVLEDFQIIAKTGSTYDGTFWLVDGKRQEVQRCNRVYASKCARYGTIYKVKNGKEESVDVTERNDETGRSDKIASLPEHCIIDNENTLTINDIDKQFYIDLAKKRVADYIGKNYKMEEIKQMATATKATKSDEKSRGYISQLNIYEKLLHAREAFLKKEVKKSGLNRFAKFKYFELADIVPTATEIFLNFGLVVTVSMEETKATATLTNVDEPSEQIRFSTLIAPDESLITNPIQKVGAIQTYVRRYLYMLVLDIVEADQVDAISGQDAENEEKPTNKSNRPASSEERDEIKKDLIDSDGQASEVQIKSIKAGLKKLRAKDSEGEHEVYIGKVVSQIKAGITKKDAEALLIEIGEKVEG